ncbi:MAG: serine/threonine-protein kinase [Planctomycetota bacterium]|jgi:serine/threonine-protein kinase
METGDAETAAEWYASEYVRQVEEGSPPTVATFLSRVPEEDRPDCRRLIEQFLHLRNLLEGAGAEFALVPGRSLGAYRVRSKLGSGGMGTVYLAEPAVDLRGLEKGQQVALKVIHPHLLAEPGFFKRFLREAEIGKRVRHENVVRTYEVDAILLEDRQVNFLVMEHVEGQTLRSLLQELGRVPEELCRHIGREVARALQAVHAAGAVHRDLKPENILIPPEQVVKLMDLGVARLVDEVIRLSQTGGFVGSVAYAAPEQFQAAPDSVDERADLYALGLVLYELATGTHPFAGDDLRNVMQRQIQEEARPAAEPPRSSVP